MLLAYHDLLSSLFSILFLLRNISSSHSIHPTIADWGSVTASVETSTGNWETDRGVWRFFFFGRCQESKNHSSSPLRTGFEKRNGHELSNPWQLLFFLKTFFRDSNLLQLLQSFKSTRKSIRRGLEGAFNQLVFTARGIVRAVLMSGKVQEIYRTAVIQNSLKPVWKEARNFRIGLDLLISFVRCINVAYMMWC